MPFYLILLTLFAALLHATWNALLRGGADKLWSMTVMCLAVAVDSAVLALFLAPPAKASWLYAVLSAVLHVGYNLFLVRSYRAGDLGQTYPIARGSSPILITAAASVFAGERIGMGALLGIVLVSGGIISLACKGRRLAVPSLPYALGTGCFIAAYSVTDGIGVRHVRRSHGSGIGIARNQRVVCGVDRLFFPGRNTDRPENADVRGHCHRHDHHQLMAAWMRAASPKRDL